MIGRRVMGRQIAALMLAMLLLCGTALGEGEFPELNGQGLSLIHI